VISWREKSIVVVGWLHLLRLTHVQDCGIVVRTGRRVVELVLGVLRVLGVLGVLRVLRVLGVLGVLVVVPSLVAWLMTCLQSSLVLVPEVPVHRRRDEEGSLVIPARSLHHRRLCDHHHQSEVPQLKLHGPLESLQRLLVFEGDLGLSASLHTDVGDLPKGAEDLPQVLQSRLSRDDELGDSSSSQGSGLRLVKSAEQRLLTIRVGRLRVHVVHLGPPDHSCTCLLT